jgi:hypothetical protein
MDKPPYKSETRKAPALYEFHRKTVRLHNDRMQRCSRNSRLRMPQAQVHCLLTPPQATQALPGIGEPLIPGFSECKRGRNEQPAADQQGEGDTGEDREKVVPTIGRFGVGSGILRR